MSDQILIDVDGVCADFSQHVCDTIGRGTVEEVADWDIFSVLDCHDIKANELQNWEWWLRLPLIEGAQEGVERLRSAGHEIEFITAPWHSCNGWTYARYLWLHRHFDVRPDEVHVTSRKHRVDGLCLIEDKPSTLDKWTLAHPGKPTILVDRPYNRKDVLHRRAHNWNDVTDFILDV